MKKQKKEKQITVTMSDELYNEIKKIAENKEHSLSHTARNFIANGVREIIKKGD